MALIRKSTYRAPLWLPGGHAQTIYPALFRRLAPVAARTERLELDVQLAIPAEQLRRGTLQIRLVSRETGLEALLRQIESPAAGAPMVLDVQRLPWGAYDMNVSFRDKSGREVVSTRRTAPVTTGRAKLNSATSAGSPIS